MNMRARVIDIETTGTTPTDGSEIIELGRVDVVHASRGWQLEEGHSRLYKPLRGIPPLNRAVHHIGEADIPADAPVCTAERLERAVWQPDPPTVLVAHNASFEASFIPASVTREIEWICTYKVAMHLLPDVAGHSNQGLRYLLDLQLDPGKAHPPHRALPDAYVTANLLVHLLQLATLEEMIAWTKMPKEYPRIPFGKFRGLAWKDVEASYLAWMVRTPGLEPDAAWCARNELDRRASAPDTPQVEDASRNRSGGRFGNRKGGVMQAAGLPLPVDDAADDLGHAAAPPALFGNG